MEITQQEVIDLLNDLLNRDPKAISGIFLNHINYNRALGSHPGVFALPSKTYSLGAMGIINILLGNTKDSGFIYAYVGYDNTCHQIITKFGGEVDPEEAFLEETDV